VPRRRFLAFVLNLQTKLIMKSKLAILCSLSAILAFAPLAQAQVSTNAPAPYTPTNNTSAAQEYGEEVLDNIPILSSLTNLPTTTFALSKFEVLLGLQTDGATINNSIAAHYNFSTNFFALGQFTLAGTASVVNSAGLGGGVRKVWPNYEIYGGFAGNRNFSPGVDAWSGEAFGGIAYRASSGVSIYCQVDTFISESTKQAQLLPELGICFPF